jgi:hypothetical protein
VSEAQLVDWHHMEEQQDPIYIQVITACESHHIKKLMGVHYDWTHRGHSSVLCYLVHRGGRRCEGNALNDGGQVVPYHL